VKKTNLCASKAFVRTLGALSLTLGLVWGASAASAQTPGGRLKAAAAVRVVNPDKPAVPIGHGGTTPHSSVHADIRIQAVAIQDEAANRLVWIGWDFCEAPAEVVDRIKNQLSEAYALNPAAVCINASHTHSAPALLLREAPAPEHFDSVYADSVVEETIAVVGQALRSLQPAKLRYCEDACKVGINRRLKRDGRVVMAPNPDGAVDHRVQVIAIEAEKDARLISVVVKYACHPVTVGPRGLGSDYPGFMRKIVEQAHPGTVAVFLQGCGADVRIRVVNKDMSGWVEGNAEAAEGFGRELAEGVERALKKPGTSINGPIEAAYTEIQLPLGKVSEKAYRDAAGQTGYDGAWGKKFAAMLDRKESIPITWPYRIQAFRLGSGNAPFTLVALEGEVFTEYGLNLGKALAPAITMVLGYSNDTRGYVPTAEAIREGGYEPGAYTWWLIPGPYAPEAEPKILDAAAALARPRNLAPR
jgi:neutral ceramidase